MQKAFEKIVERLEEEAFSHDELDYDAYYLELEDAVGIVRQVGMKYSHRNDDLVIGASHRIESLEDVINRLQYKADNIKAKLEPSYFIECIDYLKSLNDGWIPCEERLPKLYEPVLVCNKEGRVFIRCINWISNGRAKIPYWSQYSSGIVAWQPLPQSYRPKGE